jgi:hypothetical protein
MLRLLALTVFLASGASAQAPADGLYITRYRSTASARSFEVPYGSMTTHVVLGRGLRPRHQTLYAIDNDNDLYAYEATLPRGRCNVALVADGRVIAESGTSTGRSTCAVGFQLDRRAADAIARALGVPRRDRQPTGERVSARFAPVRYVVRSGERVELALILSNPARADPVSYLATPGPHYRFRANRNGAALPPWDDWANAWTGPAGFAPLASGGSAVLLVDLTPRLDLSAPGHYRIECTYETQLAPADADPFTEADRHRTWLRTFTSTVDLEVIP